MLKKFVPDPLCIIDQIKYLLGKLHFLYIFFEDCLSFCPFTFSHYIFCLSLNYYFWLPLWYVQTFLNILYSNFSPGNYANIVINKM